MREIIRMITVLTVLCAFSGGLLAALRDGTQERIENQQLEFVKGPAIRAILKGSSNDPIADRFKIKDGETERNIFVGQYRTVNRKRLHLKLQAKVSKAILP